MNKKLTLRHLLLIFSLPFTFYNPCFAQSGIKEVSLGFGTLNVINKIQINPGTKLRSYTGITFSVDEMFYPENLPAICLRTSANYISTYVQRKNFRIHTPHISWYSLQAGPSYSMSISDKYNLRCNLLAGGSYLPYTDMNGYFFGKTFGVSLSSSVYIEREISRNIVFKAFELLEGLIYDKNCHYILSSALGLSICFIF